MYEVLELSCNKNKELQKQNKDLEERIENAIEYIKENKNKIYASYGDNEDDVED